MAFNTPSYEDLLEQNKANIRSKFPDASLLSRSFLTVYAKIIAMATYGLYKFGEWISARSLLIRPMRKIWNAMLKTEESQEKKPVSRKETSSLKEQTMFQSRGYGIKTR